MTRTVVFGLLLAFLLFTPQGHLAGEMAFGIGIAALFPDPVDPGKAAATAVAKAAIDAKVQATNDAFARRGAAYKKYDLAYRECLELHDKDTCLGLGGNVMRLFFEAGRLDREYDELRQP